jgi:hypothetical protein
MNKRQKRLIEVYEHLRQHYGIHTKSGFAEVLKYGRTSMSAAMNGDEKYLTDNLFKNICETYPGVFNLDYLLTGDGELLAETNGPMPQEPQPATPTLDTSSYLNALLAKTDETIAAMKRELATKDELIAAKDDRIADLTKLAEERLHRIAELRRIIDANSLSIAGYPFTPGVADQPNATP